MFLVLISLPLLGMILGFDRSFVLEENRNLATRPELKLARPGLARVSGAIRGLLQRPVRLPETADLLAGAREGARPGRDLDARRHARARRLAVPRERRGRFVVPGNPAVHARAARNSTGRSSRRGVTGWPRAEFPMF